MEDAGRITAEREAMRARQEVFERVASSYPQYMRGAQWSGTAEEKKQKFVQAYALELAVLGGQFEAAKANRVRTAVSISVRLADIFLGGTPTWLRDLLRGPQEREPGPDLRYDKNAFQLAMSVVRAFAPEEAAAFDSSAPLEKAERLLKLTESLESQQEWPNTYALFLADVDAETGQQVVQHLLGPEHAQLASGWRGLHVGQRIDLARRGFRQALAEAERVLHDRSPATMNRFIEYSELGRTFRDRKLPVARDALRRTGVAHPAAVDPMDATLSAAPSTVNYQLMVKLVLSEADQKAYLAANGADKEDFHRAAAVIAFACRMLFLLAG